MAKQTTKRRPKKNKSLLKGRLKFYALTAILSVALIALFTVSFNHFYDIVQKDETIGVVNSNTEISSQNATTQSKPKPKYEHRVKFNKEENLTKIFSDPDTINETASLAQKDAPKQSKPKSKQKQIEIVKAELNKTAIPQEELKIPEIKHEEPKKPQDVIKIADLNISHTPKLKSTPKFEDNKTIETKLDDNKSEAPKAEQKAEIISKKTEKKQPKVEQKAQPKKIALPAGKKPKLVIIIDDVASKEHVKMIHQTGLKLTPSFFPRSSVAPKTPELVKGFSFYMIHLPLESLSGNGVMPDTMKTGDSLSSIEKKIAKIRSDFKNAKYINNHTGSKFTSDEKALNKLFEALEKHKFTFVDSRTIATTRVQKVAQKYAKPYIMRDVFLDDSNDKLSIKKSLDEAIATAKRNGYAIAIGHPRSNTMKVLRENKNHILNNVDVVYLNEISGYYR